MFVTLLVLPTYSNGNTLIAVNGPRVLVALGVPIFIALVPLCFHKARIPAGIAMTAFVLIAGLSIGLFYTPSAVMLLWPHVDGAGRSE